jgi:hypothetical protein
MADVVKINYPPDGTSGVPGGGGLCTWGFFDATVINPNTVSGTWTAVDVDNNNAPLANGNLIFGPGGVSPVSPCGWYAPIGGLNALVANGHHILLTVNLSDTGGHHGSDHSTFTVAQVVRIFKPPTRRGPVLFMAGLLFLAIGFVVGLLVERYLLPH